MSQIIIIHPGSLYLRIGRANDLNPEVILNCVARRRKPGGQKYSDYILPQPVPERTKEVVKEMDESRLSVSHILQSCLQSDGRKRYGTSFQQISAFNKRTHAEIVSGKEQFWLKPKDNVQSIVGADVLRLDPNGPFNLHLPIRRGELNVHKNVGGSVFSVLDDIRTIWEEALRDYLEVDLRDIHLYKAVLIIPDIYNRKRIKDLTALLFQIGFSACFLGNYSSQFFKIR